MNIIYVDDEKAALENFWLMVKDFPEVTSLQLFQEAEEVEEWVKNHSVDAAFLDMEMPVMHGLEMAKRLTRINRSIRIIFVTAFEQYALEAFQVDATGYLLKPYSPEEVHKELNKAARFRPLPQKKVYIQTIPDFLVWVDGVRLPFGRAKVEELFALLVDHGIQGVTTEEIIACLWPGRVSDVRTQSLCRMTYKRLMDILKIKEIDNIIRSEGRKRYLVQDQVECDLYQILSGDKDALKNYAGEYLRRYSWAEMRNAQLNKLTQI